MRKKIESFDGLTNENFWANPGRITQLLVVVTGTNNAGQVGGFINIGQFLLTRNGNQQFNRNANDYAQIGDIRAGKNILSSVDGGAFQASFVIPFFEQGFPNAFNIQQNKELAIEFQPADDGTVFADLNVEVYAEMEQIEEQYNYAMQGYFFSYGSAQSSTPEPLTQQNITSIYLDDLNDVVTNVEFEQNGQTVISSQSFLALLAGTIYQNRIEDSTFDLAQIRAYTPGVRGSTLAQTSQLTFSTSGGGDIRATICSMKWNAAA